MGFAIVGSVSYESYFGDVDENFAMDTTDCIGTESDLNDCPYDPTDDCDGTEAAGVSCYETEPRYFPLLVDGSAPNEGNVLMQLEVENLCSMSYGPVCDDSWDLEDVSNCQY